MKTSLWSGFRCRQIDLTMCSEDAITQYVKNGVLVSADSVSAHIKIHRHTCQRIHTRLEAGEASTD